jgi:hypothetical protein
VEHSLGCMTANPPPGSMRLPLALPAVTGLSMLRGMPVGFFTLWKSYRGSPFVGHRWMKCPTRTSPHTHNTGARQQQIVYMFGRGGLRVRGGEAVVGGGGSWRQGVMRTWLVAAVARVSGRRQTVVRGAADESAAALAAAAVGGVAWTRTSRPGDDDDDGDNSE